MISIDFVNIFMNYFVNILTFCHFQSGISNKQKFLAMKKVQIFIFASNFLQIFSFLINLNPIPLLLTKLITENDKIVKILIFDKSTPAIDDIVSDVIKKIVDKPLEINLVNDFSLIARDFNSSVILMVNSLENFRKFEDGVKKQKFNSTFPMKFVIFCEHAVINDFRKLPMVEWKIK